MVVGGDEMEKNYRSGIVKTHVSFEKIPTEVRMQYLRPGEILSIQEKSPVVYQPIGTLEWHGRHNPIGCDAIKAESLCIETAKLTGGVVVPPIYFSADAYRDCGNGYGYGMDAEAGFLLPGSFYKIDHKLLRDFLLNACKNYLDRGFKQVCIVSGHNATIQKNLLDEVCYILKKENGEEPVWSLFEFEAIKKGDPKRKGDHAGGYETSMMLYLAQDRVNMDANDNTAIPKLAVYEEFPVEEASEEEGNIRQPAQAKHQVNEYPA